MSESLFSQSWYRVAPLIPRLRSHIQIHHHIYRGRDWYVIQDHFSGLFHRFSPEAYHVIGLMDGRRTLAQIWTLACKSLGDHMPTQDEVIAMLSRLFQLNMIQTSGQVNVADLEQRNRRGQNSLFMANVRSPLALRMPIFDPDRFLTATMPFIRPFLGRMALLIWLLVVCAGVTLLLVHWTDLTQNLSDKVFALENLFLISLIYPVVKVFHEFGHAYMIKKWGGEVHEMGIMLLVFFPIPYVEASSSLSFRDKKHRMLVGAAGILIELFIAAVALLLWLNVEPGMVRATLFNVMLISGVSTLLFNGNPLLRFDAYYVFADFLEIPNLGPRSSSFWGYLLQRYLLRNEQVESPADSQGEAWWLAIYGGASLIYRIFISLRIVLFIAGKSLILGVILACWTAINMFILPFMKKLQVLFNTLRTPQKKQRVLWLLVLPICILVGMICFYPAPSYTICAGVTWVPDDAKLFAGADGFIADVLVPSGTYVEKGTALIRLENSQLEAFVRQLESRLEEFQMRYQVSLQSNRNEMKLLAEEIAHWQAELAVAKERIASLTIRSHTHGFFLLPDEQDLKGRYVRRGSACGYVLEKGRMQIRALVTQVDIERVRNATDKVQVRVSDNLAAVYPAVIDREVPAASHELPSMALSLQGGGPFALDPRNDGRPKVYEQLFQFALKTTEPLPDLINEHAYVRFEHAPEPLLWRWLRLGRLLMLRRFAI